MLFSDVFLTAITQIRLNKLRSFFTLLGIIVSVAFLVAVIAIIQGMHAYVKKNIADAMIGSDTFQVRRTPISIAMIQDDDWMRIQRRRKITPSDADIVRRPSPTPRRSRRPRIPDPEERSSGMAVRSATCWSMESRGYQTIRIIASSMAIR
jgi:hypothetical protein